MQPAVLHTSAVTANDRLKQRSRSWLPRSIVLAVIIHAAVLSLAPEMSVAEMSVERATDVFIVPQPRELPEPPEQIARPAQPIIGTTDIPTDVTPPVIDFGKFDPGAIKPPAAAPESGRGDFELFVPSMVAPVLLNAKDVERELVRTYPPMLREAGIGGQVDVNLWLDEDGTIVRAEIARSSGREPFDAAALKVVSVMKLAPAMNRNRPVRVIVTLPVKFTSQ